MGNRCKFGRLVGALKVLGMDSGVVVAARVVFQI